MVKKILKYLCFAIIIAGCNNNSNSKLPVVAFIDGLQDETLEQAHKGFMDALSLYGYSDSAKTIKVVYRNAQGDNITLGQCLDYAISQNPVLIATNPSMSTTAAVKKTKNIPIFMMVSPSPQLADLINADGNAPANLLGVYENQDYIDTSVALIKTLIPKVKRIGVIYNQAESQSVTAINRVKETCKQLGVELVLQSAGSSNDVQLVTEAVLSKKVDAFFAMPDNVVFSAFEIIQKECNRAKVPIFTSEVGLVKRGAVCAYGADMYKWGYQSGLQAAQCIKNKSTIGLKPEAVLTRKKVCNIKAAQNFGINLPVGYEAVH